MEQIKFLIILSVLFIGTGAKNGSYYARKYWINFLIIVLLMIMCFMLAYFYAVPYMAYICTLFLYWQLHIFSHDLGKQIHLSEYFVGFSIRLLLFLIGMDLYLMLLSTYWIETVFKAPINLFIGRKAIERIDGTNDDTGKTVDFWLFGKQYNVPRVSNGYTKLYLGIIGLLIWAILYQLGITFVI
jgi:hypothetical protein